MVKITFKTLQQKQFQIEADPSDTILAVKEKIAKDQGFAVETQKIIYSGKILTDDKTVADANLKEKDFCVVMVSKPKAVPAPAAASTSASTAPPSTPAQPIPTPAVPDAPAPASGAPPSAETPAPSSADASASAPPAAAPAAGGDPSFVVGSHLEAAVANMVEMGFPVDQVKRALRASFNNPDRAVEYLFNGIPAGLGNDPPAGGNPAPTPAGQAPSGAIPPTPATPSPAGGRTANPRNLFEAAQNAPAPTPSTDSAAAAAAPRTGAGAGAGSLSDLAQLSQNPAFVQLRQIVQSNPAMLQPFLQQLGATNPGLLELINRNQQAFVSWLQEGAEGAAGSDEDMDALMDQFGGEGGEGGDGSQYVQVTEEEKAAIERLVGMGFERNLVIQAFLACDRNEELAANYLVEHGWNEEEF